MKINFLEFLKEKKGLTLVEIFIIMGIIVILISAVLVSINPQRRMAMSRDNQREVHLYTIWGAMEEMKHRDRSAWEECEFPLEETRIASEQHGGYDLYDCIGDYLRELVYDPIDGDYEEELGVYDTDYYMGVDREGNIYLKSEGETRTIIIGELKEYDHRLTIAVVGEGTTNPSPGEHPYEEGETVSLVAQADSGWYFDGWTGDYQSPQSEISITMDDDKGITANFEETVVGETSCANSDIVTWSDNDGTGSDCGPAFFGWGYTNHGETGTVSRSNEYRGEATYLCNDGTWEFESGWCELNIDESCSNTTAMTWSDGDGSGDNCGPSSFGAGSTEDGETNTVDYANDYIGEATYLCDAGEWEFESGTCEEADYASCDNTTEVTWSDGDGTGNNCGPSSFGPTGSTGHGYTSTVNYENDYIGEATYECDDGAWDFHSGDCNIEHQLTIDSGNGGYTNPSEGTYTHTYGDSVSVGGISHSGWEFSHWTGDYPSGQSGNSQVTIEMNSNKSVTANFKEEEVPTYSIFCDVGEGNGSTGGDCGTTVEHGDSATITASATPFSGYAFSHWSGDASGTSTSYTFSNVTSNKSATAHFEDFSACGGSKTMTHDGQTYDLVVIGNQCWMAENMNSDSHDWAGAQSWCYNHNSSNCDIYGRLYDWNTALGICPDGWDLPTDEQWKILEGNIDSVYGVGHEEWDRAHDYRGYDAGVQLDDPSGFNGAIRGGMRGSNGNFHDIDHLAVWWSRTPGPQSTTYDKEAYTRERRHVLQNDGIYRTARQANSHENPGDAYSVRCIKN